MKHYTTTKHVKAAKVEKIYPVGVADYVLSLEGGAMMKQSQLGNGSAGLPRPGDYVVDYPREDGSNPYFGWCPKTEFERSAGIIDPDPVLFKVHGPFQIKIDLLVTNDATGETGTATISLPVLRHTTPDLIQRRIDNFEQHEMAEALPGYRLLTKPETWQVALREFGIDPAATPPGGDSWDAWHPSDAEQDWYDWNIVEQVAG